MSDVIKCDMCGTIVHTDKPDYTYYTVSINTGPAIVFGDSVNLPGADGKDTADCCTPTCVARAVGISWG